MAEDTKVGADAASVQEDDLSREIKARWKAVEIHYGKWLHEAKDDLEFALGDQWTEKERQDLEKAARPCLTFNRIRPLINLIAGHQRENSSRIKVNPEGGEDRIFSEVMDKGIKYIDKGAHLNYKMGYWFDDGLYVGKGWIEAIISYDKDPIRGSIMIKQRTPFQIFPDPEFKEYDLNEGCRYCFKLVRLPKSELLELYPDKAALIKGFVVDNDDRVENGSGLIGQEGDADNYGENANKATVVKSTDQEEETELEEDIRFTVKEYWKPKLVEKFFVINKESGEPDKFDTKEEAEKFVTTQGFGKVIPRKVPEMHVAAYVGGFVVQEEKSPCEPYYSGYTFFRFLADWAPSAETEVLRVQGITRPLKDPQREKNKAKSSYLHILSTQANTGWIGDDDALTDTGWKALEKRGAKPGLTIRKKRGRELREINTKGPHFGHIQREEKADEEFKQISMVNPDLMGFQEKTASGRAISLRIKQAIMALVRLFSNYRYSKEILGNFLLAMMPMLFDSKKLMRVLGPDYMKKALDAEKYPEGLKEGHIDAFLQLVKDSKYDVFVAEADQNATIRYETFMELAELLKAGAPVPMSLLIKYMDIPNSEEVLKEIKEYQQQLAQQATAGTKK